MKLTEVYGCEDKSEIEEGPLDWMKQKAGAVGNAVKSAAGAVKNKMTPLTKRAEFQPDKHDVDPAKLSEPMDFIGQVGDFVRGIDSELDFLKKAGNKFSGSNVDPAIAKAFDEIESGIEDMQAGVQSTDAALGTARKTVAPAAKGIGHDIRSQSAKDKEADDWAQNRVGLRGAPIGAKVSGGGGSSSEPDEEMPGDDWSSIEKDLAPKAKQATVTTAKPQEPSRQAQQMPSVASAVPDPTVKKGRGRPRINPPKDPNAPKKSPGRPKKDRGEKLSPELQSMVSAATRKHSRRMPMTMDIQDEPKKESVENNKSVFDVLKKYR